MKRIYILISACAAIVSLAACHKEDYTIENDPDLFAVYPIAQVVSRDGGEYTLKITGHEHWTLSVAESNVTGEWCVPDIVEGDGAGTVIFKVTPANSPANRRSMVVEISSGEHVLKAKIVQETLQLFDNEVLINGVIWADSNVGAPGTFTESPDEVGMYYQFNRKVGYPSSGGVPANWPADYVNDDTDWMPENDPCPEGYRICTAQEMVDLWDMGFTWAPASQTGFERDGMIVGVPAEVAVTATKENIKSLGALFIPKSGWRTETGNLDRDWLAVVRTGTQLSATHGGMTLGDASYQDIWGWGDGQKPRASAVRCVRNIKVE